MLTLFFSPFLRTFELNNDEGINLVKASLLSHGYPLHERVWTDQPPVYTCLLSAAFRIFGERVPVARTITLLLSCVLLWAAILCLRYACGRMHALIAGVLISTLPWYLMLSGAAMIGLPAIALAMLSLLAITQWHLRRGAFWLVASGATLAFSVFTKGFTAFLIPVFCLGIVMDGRVDPRVSAPPPWRRVALWLGGFLVVAGVLFVLLVGPTGAEQLLRPHLVAATSSYQTTPALVLPKYFGENSRLLVLALAGAILALWRRQWVCLYVAAWAIGAFILLSYHRPAFPHHQLLVTVPAAMLASILIAELLLYVPRILASQRMKRPARLTLASATGALAVGCVMLTALPGVARMWHELSGHTDTSLEARKNRLLEKVRENAHDTHWMVTDQPMYAFRAGLLVPPSLAVFSEKRLMTGALTESMIIATIREMGPEQVLLTRLRLPAVRAYVEQNYLLIYSRDRAMLYLKKTGSK